MGNLNNYFIAIYSKFETSKNSQQNKKQQVPIKQNDQKKNGKNKFSSLHSIKSIFLMKIFHFKMRKHNNDFIKHNLPIIQFDLIFYYFCMT
jgi:hypothetical protein